MISVNALFRKLDHIYATSPIISFDECSRIVMLSDCHRGQGNGADNFLPNSTIFQGAMEYYYKQGYTYIELGDGDELWENRCFHTILRTHSNVFRLMNRLYQEGRLYMLYGNHDMVKKKGTFPGSSDIDYYCDTPDREPLLFHRSCTSGGIRCTESLVLENRNTGQRLFLIHGHQGSLLNDELWPLGRFLVRYVWRPLEVIGFHAPTGGGRSVKLTEKIEKELCAYAENRHRILIAGHTHRPAFPAPTDDSCPYFNTGSCVHPYCIIGLEMVKEQISLVRWSVTAAPDRSLTISREILNGPADLAGYMLS